MEPFKNMKKNVFLFFTFVLSLVLTNVFISCSSENDAAVAEPSNKKVHDFLKSYYKDDYELGKDVKLSIKAHEGSQFRTAQVENYSITEVYVGNDDRARGYIFENLQTNEVESFVDVDRTNFKLTSVDLESLQVEVQNAINQMPEYFLTNEFDIIKAITDPIAVNPTNPQNSTFGWHYSYGACGNGFRGVYRAYYLLGIRLTSWEPVYNDDGSPYTEPC